MAQPGDTTFSPGFQALPTELIGAICGLLSNSDIKSLHLTCRYPRDKSPLRIDRVFISANPRNIEVLLDIANHDVFRHRVKEIIWNDAVLKSIPNKYTCGYSADENDSDNYVANEDKEWISSDFIRSCKESAFLAKSRLIEKNKHQGDNKEQGQFDKLMPFRDSLYKWNPAVKTDCFDLELQSS
ncbi:hypothetical protein ACHAP5_003428 [Fusarium lateritium]